MGTRGRSDTAGWNIVERPAERRRTLSGSLTDLLSPWRNSWSFDPKSVSLLVGKKRQCASRPGDIFGGEKLEPHVKIGSESQLLPLLTFVLLILSALFAGAIATALFFG